MEKLRILRLLLIMGIAFAFPGAPAQEVAPVKNNLAFDAVSKELIAKATDPTAEFTFSVTNISEAPITITSVTASCGCTTPKLPPLPWTLAPGTNGAFDVTIDLRGKSGTFQKNVFMETSDGRKTLFLKVQMPEMQLAAGAPAPLDARGRNAQMAAQNRQIVFKGECASCHRPAADAMGEKLFVNACAICHESDHRATSVPDLHALKATPTPSYWEAWVRFGKTGTMMPAFAMEHEGPLTDPQIASLVKYLTADFPNRKPVGAAALPLTPAVKIPAIAPRPTASVQP